MSITLPPGRYHVIFRYRFPGILKLLALLFTVMFVSKWLEFSFLAMIWGLVSFIYSRLETFHKHFLWVLRKAWNVLYYHFVGTNIDSLIRRFNLINVRSKLYKPCRFNKFSNELFNQFKHGFNASREKFVTVVRRNFNGEEKMIAPTDTEAKCRQNKPVSFTRKSSSNQENNSLSDADSAFDCEGLIYHSLPTPPKHTKKSFRKRRAYFSGEIEDHLTYKTPTPLVAVETFQASSTSPGLGNILESLRRNSSPERNTFTSPSFEKYMPLIESDRSSRQLSSQRYDTAASLFPDFRMKMEKSSPNLEQVVTKTPICEAILKRDNHAEQNDYFCKNQSVVDQSPRYNSCGSEGDWEWDGMIFETSYSGASTDQSTSVNEINVDQMVHVETGKCRNTGKSLTFSMEDESFSPRSSSSPESNGSQEQHSSSPDINHARDNFECLTLSQKENTKCSPDDHLVYRIYLPESPKEEVNAKNKCCHTVHFTSKEDNTMNVQNEIFIKTEEHMGASPNPIEHQLRRKRYSRQVSSRK